MVNYSYYGQAWVRFPRIQVQWNSSTFALLSKLEINARKFEKTRIRFNRDRKIGELSVPLKKSWLRLLFLLLILSLIIHYRCDEFFPQITPLLEFKSGSNIYA